MQRRFNLECLESRIVLDSTVVFNEVMYHPADEQIPEWVELHNQNSVNMDLSGWSLADGIDYTFPVGTVIPGGGYLVVAADPEAMQAATGLTGALGPFTRRLSNGGEQIELVNNTNRVMDKLDYGDNAPWPVGPDGSGVTLAKFNQHTSTAEAANWTFSVEMGGTPGTANFLEPGTFAYEELLPEGATARALVPFDLDNSLGQTWIDPQYDDSLWTVGTTGVGYDSGRSPTYLEHLGLNLESPPDGQTPIPMQLGNSRLNSLYIRIPFQINTDFSDADQLPLRMKYDDGFVAYINGTEVASANAPGRNGEPGTLMWSSAATGSHRDRDALEYTDFDISGFADALVQGDNMLAIHALNSDSRSDDDFLMLPQIVVGREVLPDASLPLELNELAAGGDDFWVEIANTGDQPVDVGGVLLSATGETGGQYILPSQTVDVGEFVVVRADQLGFSATPDESLFLYAPEKARLLDAASITDRLRGRSDQLDGRWMYPSVATQGEPNRFQFHDDIVINEIMYHAAPDYATADTPPVYDLSTVLPFDAVWRYNESRANLGLDWQRTTHPVDNADWQQGQGVLGFESSSLDEPIRTTLVDPRDSATTSVTYYFETEFDVGGDLEAIDALQLTYQVDDGAIFYLNGHEVHRFNMPAEFVFASTEAKTTTRNAEKTGPVAVPAEFLRPGTNLLSAEVHLEKPNSNDVVFGAEVAIGEEIAPGIPGMAFAESAEEWLELYNRSQTEATDLSGWQLTDAIDFTFPDGTTIGPGQFIVIASDPAALESLHTDTLSPGSVLGPFEGSLSNSNEQIVLLDSASNVADEVRYYDGGRWHAYADGGGSSLELRDPNADNTKSEAWTPSDESGVLDRSSWQHFSYTRTVEPLVHGPPVHFHEFHMGMLDGGEVLLDNISLIEDPDGENTELLQNGGFQSDEFGSSASKWRIQGTHGDSHVIADPDNPENKVLHLIAEARTNYFGNHAETTLAGGQRVDNGQTYQISFDAKWIAGSPQLHTELHYKDAVRTTIVPMPEQTGTPGAANSRLEENVGPTYAGLRHSPLVPKENQPVTVTVSAADPDGVSGLTLVWAVDGGPFTRTMMVPGTGGSFSGLVPGQDDRSVVQFYVEGLDTRQAISTYPAEGPDSRALYKVDDDFKPDPLRHDFQIIMLPAEASNLHAVTEIIDNDRTGSTIIYRAKDVYYDVGTRLKGSMFSRNGRDRAGFSVRFHPDQLFRGVHDVINIDRANKQEIQVKHLIRQAGMLGGMYDDVVNVASPLGTGDGPSPLLMARQDDVFLDSQFENGSDGTVYKFEGIRVITDSQGDRPENLKIYQPVSWVGNFDITDLGDGKELYRWPFLITNNRDKDDFTRMIDLAKAFSLEGQELQDAVAEVLDVDQWMQTFAMMSLAGIGDTYSQGNPHNLTFYQRPSDNKMLVFPWDWDFTFNQSATSALHGGKNIGKIINLPVYERLFMGHMLDMINTVFNVEYMSDWIDHYGTMVNMNFGSNLTYIRRRGESVLGRLPDEIPFEITSGGGQAVNTTRATIGLEGQGWINVREIRLAGQTEPLSITWTDIDRWQVDFPLSSGLNTIALEAYDAQGEQIGADEVTITYDSNATVSDVLISEVNYRNTEVPRLSREDPEAFDFVELYNQSETPVDLSDWRISGDIQFAIPSGTTIGPSEAIVVFPFDSNDLVKTFSLEVLFGVGGNSMKMLGPYTGQLNDDGGLLRLERPGADPVGVTDHRLVDEVFYDNLPPWPVTAGGGGDSLTRRSLSRLGTSPRAWIGQPPTPGSAEFVLREPGDSNGDGLFNAADIRTVLDGGKYLTGQPATYAEGDWNEDGLFDQLDVVTALQLGDYALGALAAKREQLVDAAFGH